MPWRAAFYLPLLRGDRLRADEMHDQGPCKHSGGLSLERGVGVELPDLDFVASTLNMHRGGKIHVASAFPLMTRADLARAYTPGVADVCRARLRGGTLMVTHTVKCKTVAV